MILKIVDKNLHTYGGATGYRLQQAPTVPLPKKNHSYIIPIGVILGASYASVHSQP